MNKVDSFRDDKERVNEDNKMVELDLDEDTEMDNKDKEVASGLMKKINLKNLKVKDQMNHAE